MIKQKTSFFPVLKNPQGLEVITPSSLPLSRIEWSDWVRKTPIFEKHLKEKETLQTTQARSHNTFAALYEQFINHQLTISFFADLLYHLHWEKSFLLILWFYYSIQFKVTSKEVSQPLVKNIKNKLSPIWYQNSSLAKTFPNY